LASERGAPAGHTRGPGQRKAVLCPERLAGSTGGGNRHRTGAHPPHPSASPHAASRIGPGAPKGGGVLAAALRPAGGGGVLLRRLPDGSLRFPFSLPAAGFCSAGPNAKPFCLAGPRGPGALRSPLPSRRAASSLSAPLHHRCPAPSPARSGAAGAQSPSPP
jgi:hypothetical protein